MWYTVVEDIVIACILGLSLYYLNYLRRCICVIDIKYYLTLGATVCVSILFLCSLFIKVNVILGLTAVLAYCVLLPFYSWSLTKVNCRCAYREIKHVHRAIHYLGYALSLVSFACITLIYNRLTLGDSKKK